MLILLLICGIEASQYIEPVYWNIENPRFVNNYTRHVQLQQKMDIFCPRRRVWNQEGDETQSVSHHYQTIYMVKPEDFEKCQVDLRTARKLMTCRTPEVEKKYTIIFQEVNPNPFGFEFEADQPYYFISTSKGHSDAGLASFKDGVCSANQMKLKIQVHQGDEERVQKLSARASTAPFDEAESQLQVSGRESLVTRDAEQEKQDVIVFNNFLIIGIVLGVILVLMIILVAFLTRRSFQRRKNLSYPTLSDYQSSYVESYDYSHPSFSRKSGEIPLNGGQTMVDLKTSPPPLQPAHQLNHVESGRAKFTEPNMHHQLLPPDAQKSVRAKKTKEEFSYIDGRLLNARSNRASNVIVI